MLMRIPVAVLYGALAIALAGPVLAQRSLFDPPAGPAAAPPAAEAPPATERRAKPRPRKPKGPVPARTLAVVNASPNTLTGLEVTGEGKSAKLAKPLKPKGRANLKLPALKTCTVTIAATFEGAGQVDSSEFDICKDKTIRFTE